MYKYIQGWFKFSDDNRGITREGSQDLDKQLWVALVLFQRINPI